MGVVNSPGKVLYLDRVELEMLKEVLRGWLISELTTNYKYKTMQAIYGRIYLLLDQIEAKGGAQ